eukprot:gene4213-20400_t
MVLFLSDFVILKESSVKGGLIKTNGTLFCRRPTCVCNTTCARRSGKRRGCPCKDSNLACTDACACGRKKRGTVIEWCSNGKNVINDLPIETLHNLIVELAVTGEGSFEFVQDLVPVIQSPNPEANRPMALPWCKCGVCTEMGKEEENKCCKVTICVTSYYMFKKLCLDRDVLKLNITARCDLRADHMTFTMNSFRKAAYRQFALWIMVAWEVEIGEFYQPVLLL